MAQLRVKKAWSETLNIIRNNYGIYAVVSLVAVAVGLLFDFGFDGVSGGVYQRVWGVLVFGSYIWLVAQLLDGKTPKLRQVFYDGSGNFVRLTLTLMTIIFYLIPLLLGATIYLYIQQPLSGAATAEVVGSGILWALLGGLSFYWLIRSAYAPFVANRFSPINAIRESWRLSKKHWKGLSVHWALLVLALLALSGGILYVIALLFSIDASSAQAALIITRALAAVNYLVVLPFYVTYISVILKNVDTKTNRR